MLLSLRDSVRSSHVKSLLFARLHAGDAERSLLVLTGDDRLLAFERPSSDSVGGRKMLRPGRMLFQQSIHGPVLDAQVCPSSTRNGPERLVLLLEGSRVCVLECVNYRFVNVQLHHFNQHNSPLAISGVTGTLSATLAVDPEGQCLALLLNETHLAIIPQQFAQNVDEEESTLPFTLPISAIDERLRRVMQMALIPGFKDPTLALMGRTVPNAAVGRLNASKDSTWFAMVTVDVARQCASVICFVANLPTDLVSMRVLPRPQPVGGCLLIGSNSVVHVEAGSPMGVGLALNAFCSRTSSAFSYSTVLNEPVMLTRSDLAVCVNGADTFAFGEGLLVTLRKHGRFVSGFDVQRSGVRWERMAVDGNVCVHVASEQIWLTSLYDHHDDDAKVTVVEEQEPQTEKASFEDTDLYLQELAAMERQERTQQHRRSASQISAGQLSFAEASPWMACLQTPTHLAFNDSGDAYVVTDDGSLAVVPQKLPLREGPSFEVAHGQSVCTVALPTPSSSSSLIFVSTQTSTLILKKSKERVTEVDSSGLYVEGVTRDARLLSSPSPSLAQVADDGVYVVDAATLQSKYRLSHAVAKFDCSANGITGVLDQNRQLHVYCESTLVHSVSNVQTFCLTDTDVLYVTTSGELCIARHADSTLGCWFSNANIALLPAYMANRPTPMQMALTDGILDVAWHGDCLWVLSQRARLCAYRWFPQRGYFMSVHGRFVAADCKRIGWWSAAMLAVSDLLIDAATFASVQNPLHVRPLESTSFCGVRASRVALYDLSLPSIMPNALMGQWCHLRPRLAESLGHVAVHASTGAVVVVARKCTPWTLPVDEWTPISDQPEYAPPDGAPKPVGFTYSLLLVSPQTFDVIDEWTGALPFEVFTRMLLAELDTKQTATGRKAFVAVGTAWNKGEDRPGRGRLLILDIVSVVADVDRADRCLRFKQMVAHEVKGGVLAVAGIDGCLMASLGGKTFLFSLDNDDALEAIGVSDNRVGGIDIATIKNYFVVGDALTGLSFHAFQREPAKVVALGRDLTHAGCLLEFRSVAYIYDSTGQLLLVGADYRRKQLAVYSYAPMDRRTGNGQKLLYRGAIGLSSRPIQLLPRDGPQSSQLHCLLENGAISTIYPEQSATKGHDEWFRTMLTLQARLLATPLVPPAGGNAKAPAQGLWGQGRDLPAVIFGTICRLDDIHAEINALSNAQIALLEQHWSLAIFESMKN